MEQFDYVSLVDRLYNMMEDARVKPQKQPIKIPPPQLGRAGRDMLWLNFEDTCTVLRRTTDHVKRYVEKELLVSASLSKNNVLKARYKITIQRMESLISGYIRAFVQCGVCKGLFTEIYKDSITRLCFLECKDCKSKRAVEII